MAEKPTVDDDHRIAIRNAERSDVHEIEVEPHRPYVDPAEEVMNSNPNLSPPIHPRPN